MVGGNAISPARTEAASRGKARKRGVRRTLCWLIAGALIGWPLPTLAQSLSQGPLQKRLQAILQLSAEQMAATSSFTKRAYDAQLAHVNRIQNKQLRDTVLEFVLKPAATAYGQSATQSWLASPGSGWKSH